MNSKLKDDLVVRYAIHLAAKKVDISAPDNKLTDNEKALIEKEISNNPEVSEYIDFLQKSYTELYQDLGESAFGDITFQGKHAPERKIFRRFNYSLVRYPIAAAATVLLIMFSLTLISDVITPSYYSVIDQGLDIKLSVTRSEPALAISMGKALFNQTKYTEAIHQFKDGFYKSLEQQDQRSSALSTYYLGLTHLKNAKQSTMGLFPRYHLTQLDSAFKYLEISRRVLDLLFIKEELYLALAIVETLRFTMTHLEEHYLNAEKYLSFIIERNREGSKLALSLLNTLKKESGKNDG